MYGTSYCTLLPYVLFVNVLPVSSFSPFSSTESQTQRGQKANMLSGHYPWKYPTINRSINFPVFNQYLQLLCTVTFWEKLSMHPMRKPFHKTLQVRCQATILLMLPVLRGTSSLLWNWVATHIHTTKWDGQDPGRRGKINKNLKLFIRLSLASCPALSRSLPTRALGQKVDTNRCSWPDEATPRSNLGAKGLVLPTESWTKAPCPARQDTAFLTWETPCFLLNGMKGSSLLQPVRSTKTTNDGDVGHLHAPQQTRERMKVAKMCKCSRYKI